MERRVEHGDLREPGPGGMDRLDAGQGRRVVQRGQRDERADRGDHVVVDQRRAGELLATVHDPVAGAGQVAFGVELGEDAGHDGGKAAVAEVLLLWVPVFPADPQHRPRLADLVGKPVKQPLAALGGQQRELHR